MSRLVSRQTGNAIASVLATLLGLAVALLLAEGLVRLFFDEAVQPRFVVDSGYGVRATKANVDTRHYVPGDYDIRITTNSAGMRGPEEYPVERVPGKKRVLVLGDSFPFGYGVEDGDAVSAVLEKLLNGPAPGGYEVLNFGVAGFGQAEALVTWENRARAYRPDVVVWFYFDNDIGNNAVAKLYDVQPDGSVRRTGASFLPGTNVQDAMLSFPPLRFLFEHSEAWNLVRNRLSSLVQKALIRDQGLKDYGDATPESVALTSALLKEIVAATRRDGARPVFVIIPNGRGMTSNFPLTKDELAALQVPLIDGRDYLEASDYYRRDNHWRAIGHRKTAEKLVAVIRQFWKFGDS
jgi:hypothetical protein